MENNLDILLRPIGYSRLLFVGNIIGSKSTKPEPFVLKKVFGDRSVNLKQIAKYIAACAKDLRSLREKAGDSLFWKVKKMELKIDRANLRFLKSCHVEKESARSFLLWRLEVRKVQKMLYDIEYEHLKKTGQDVHIAFHPKIEYLLHSSQLKKDEIDGTISFWDFEKLLGDVKPIYGDSDAKYNEEELDKESDKER